MIDVVLRAVAPQVLGVLARRGHDFAAAEDALSEAVLEAHRGWGEQPPADPRGWLVTVAGRKLIDARRAEAARHRREDAALTEPAPGPTEQADDTLLVLFLCCHPALRPASAVALTLRAARTAADGSLVPLDEQDRGRWDRGEIAEGVRILQTALAAQRRGEYQIQAAIAALHADAASATETDWPQILAWYDELVALTDNPLAQLNRAVVLGRVDGPRAGLRAAAGLDDRLPEHYLLDAVRAQLHERAGGRADRSDHALRARGGAPAARPSAIT